MPDVNTLIYAHRREDPDHEFYRAWIERVVNDPEPFALSVLVAAAFVRVVAHPHFRPDPTPLPQALAVIDSLAASPSCIMPGPGENNWRLTKSLCVSVSAQGKIVADAQHAAVALEHP